MVVNIKFYYKLIVVSLIAAILVAVDAYAIGRVVPIEACVIERNLPLTKINRAKIARCLGWEANKSSSICHGSYQSMQVMPLANEDEVQVLASNVSLRAEGRSKLSGNVEIRQTQRIVNAETAYIYRDAKKNKITKIELLGEVRYLEPDRLMIAKKATINPQSKSGKIEDVLYLFKVRNASAELPAWGRARLVERLDNFDYLLRKTTYTTCSPEDKAWQIEAKEITLDNANKRGVAKNAILRIADVPVLYTPYISFPTSKERKSGFLMPAIGYSNIGGYDFALPYYLNLASNYDATIVPHEYTLRGTMFGGDLRFLTNNSTGIIGGNFLPNDKAFNKFINTNENQFPVLRNASNDRWSFMMRDNTAITSNLRLGVNYQQVSDPYYLQDFSSNLAILTENQLLREGDLTYTTDHWLFSGILQSYQTLHPINQSFVSDIYERLPQLMAVASYNDLPMNANFNMLSEYDYYRWPANNTGIPQGSRYHLDPILSVPFAKTWGYITPSVQLVENYYDVHYIGGGQSNEYNRTIPRYNVDSGLTFERSTSLLGDNFTQTLEPRLYYLNVPYSNQTQVPVYDSAYMIFNYDQLFRLNRFSGIDRVGDANQLSYAVTSRWLSSNSGKELASLAIGQISYFSDRRVGLCYSPDGICQDNPLYLGYVSPVAKTSPIASRATYNLSPAWVLSGDYVWDGYANATNNGNLNLHYQPEENHILSFGYTYLAGGNLLLVNTAAQQSPLHQATIAYAWPFTANIKGLGAYSYNISESYSMMSFVGLEYDNCCWAFRLMGGRVFQSLSPNSITPNYNNNVYFQVLLKGLGTLASSDPASTINSYLPGYKNIF